MYCNKKRAVLPTAYSAKKVKKAGKISNCYDEKPTSIDEVTGAKELIWNEIQNKMNNMDKMYFDLIDDEMIESIQDIIEEDESDSSFEMRWIGEFPLPSSSKIEINCYEEPFSHVELQVQTTELVHNQSAQSQPTNVSSNPSTSKIVTNIINDNKNHLSETQLRTSTTESVHNQSTQSQPIKVSSNPSTSIIVTNIINDNKNCLSQTQLRTPTTESVHEEVPEETQVQKTNGLSDTNKIILDTENNNDERQFESQGTDNNYIEEKVDPQYLLSVMHLHFPGQCLFIMVRKYFVEF